MERGKHSKIVPAKPKKKVFTQSLGFGPDVWVTKPGRIATAVEMFNADITSKFQIRNPMGYGELEAPGTRDVDIHRAKGAHVGIGVRKIKMNRIAGNRK